jgi:hypothetical protein
LIGCRARPLAPAYDIARDFTALSGSAIRARGKITRSPPDSGAMSSMANGTGSA